MGSFANSIHVRCEDASDVVASINDLMRLAGYGATDEAPDEDEMWGMSTTLRAIHVAESHKGWVAVLDSDLMSSLSLAVELSQQLETYAVQFMVNDSDSWHYQLFFNGAALDDFDSSPEIGEFEMGEISPEMTELLSNGGFAALQGNLEQQMSGMKEQMEAGMPADIREIQQRMQAGKSTPEDMKRYSEWAQSQAQQMMGAINEMMAGILPSMDASIGDDDDMDSDSGTSAAPGDLNSNLECLRPILRPDASDSRVLEVLGKQEVFAERTLAEFMELVDVQPIYANLSYRYLEEYGEPELRDDGVILAAHLKFANDTGAD